MKTVALTLALMLVASTAFGIGLIDKQDRLDRSVILARSILTNPECDKVFAYKAKSRSIVEVFNEDIWIAVANVPSPPEVFATGATHPPAAPRVIIIDEFWLLLRNPLDTAHTIIHELVHLMDYSLIPEAQWEKLDLDEKEGRANEKANACLASFIATYPEVEGAYTVTTAR